MYLPTGVQPYQEHIDTCPAGTYCEQQPWVHLASGTSPPPGVPAGLQGHWIVCKPDDGQYPHWRDSHRPDDADRDRDRDDEYDDDQYRDNDRYDGLLGRFISNYIDAYTSSVRHFRHLFRTRQAVQDAVVFAQVVDAKTHRYIAAPVDLQVRSVSDGGQSLCSVEVPSYIEELPSTVCLSTVERDVPENSLIEISGTLPATFPGSVEIMYSMTHWKGV